VDCSANFCCSIFAQNIIGFISTIIILFDNWKLNTYLKLEL
jgi:hypothetical protein